MEKDPKYAALFGNIPGISLEEKNRVIREIEKIGSLTFEISKDEEGWTAQCREVPGIITGNTNPNPSTIEIESQIRDAVFAAFNVKFDQKIEARQTFEYTFA